MHEELVDMQQQSFFSAMLCNFEDGVGWRVFGAVVKCSCRATLSANLGENNVFSADQVIKPS
jgi:hypothetical protein